MNAKTIAALLSCTLLASAATARAQDTTLAETLYREGKALLDAGQYGSACPKLAESFRQDPATGALLALALCYEKSGKLASAWSTYTEVAARSRREQRSDREQLARERVAALEPRLGRVLVTVAEASAAMPGFVLKRDGVVLPSAAWGSAVPVDAGEHALEASATGYKSWRQSLTVSDGAQQTIEVPALEAEASASTPSGSALTAESGSVPSAPSSSNPLRTVGLVVGGVGLVTLGVGGYFGLHAKSLNDDSKANNHCDATGCDAEGVKLRNDARSAGNVSTILFVTGGVLTAAGVTLFIVGGKSPSSASASLTVTPAVTPQGGGLILRGAL